MKDFIENLIQKSDKKYPFTLIDIGSMGGIQKKWKILKPYMRSIGFEPDEREFKKLMQSENEIYFNYALYSESKALKFYVTKVTENSSLLKPNLKFHEMYKPGDISVKIDKEIEMPAEKVKRLEDLLKENAIIDMDFIKVDTEGTELYVLQGAGDFLKRTFGLQIEVAFAQLRQGQPLFRDIDKFMSDNGYILFDIKRNYWKRKSRLKLGPYKGKGQLVFADALYFKTVEIFFQELESFSNNKEYILSKIYKSILACLIYCLFDYAEDIASSALEKEYLKKEDYDFILSGLKRLTRKTCFPKIPGRFLVYKICDKIARVLKKETGTIDNDETIGNVVDV